MEAENEEFMFVVFTEKIELVAMVFLTIVIVVDFLDLDFNLTCFLLIVD